MVCESCRVRVKRVTKFQSLFVQIFYIYLVLAAGYHFEVLVSKKLGTLRCEDGDGR